MFTCKKYNIQACYTVKYLFIAFAEGDPFHCTAFNTKDFLV
jgi:hypothetical protein